MGPRLRVLQIVTGSLEENCFLLWRAEPKSAAADAPALVFDPGADAGDIERELKTRSLRPAAFLLTHCHGDHIGALAELKRAHPEAPIVVHRAEATWLNDPLRNLSYFLGANIAAPPADATFEDGARLEYGGLQLTAIHVPGHSPGGTAFLVKDEAGGPAQLFCGDILFRGSIGRTDFPGSQGEAFLVAQIRRKLLVLPDDTCVHTGHGPDTTIGEEKNANPWCGSA